MYWIILIHRFVNHGIYDSPQTKLGMYHLYQVHNPSKLLRVEIYECEHLLTPKNLVHQIFKDFREGFQLLFRMFDNYVALCNINIQKNNENNHH